jgi:hypothetical protein
MSDGGAQLPVQIPILTVFRTMEVEKILQHLGGADQFLIEFLGEYVLVCLMIGNVVATLQIIGGKNSYLFGEGDITIRTVHGALHSSTMSMRFRH